MKWMSLCMNSRRRSTKQIMWMVYSEEGEKKKSTPLTECHRNKTVTENYLITLWSDITGISSCIEAVCFCFLFLYFSNLAFYFSSCLHHALTLTDCTKRTEYFQSKYAVCTLCKYSCLWKVCFAECFVLRAPHLLTLTNSITEFETVLDAYIHNNSYKNLDFC